MFIFVLKFFFVELGVIISKGAKMSVKVAINGFGRIGRCAARIILERDDVELVAINDTATRDMTRYLLKYDSVHGEFKQDVKVISDDFIEVNGKR